MAATVAVGYSNIEVAEALGHPLGTYLNTQIECPTSIFRKILESNTQEVLKIWSPNTFTPISWRATLEKISPKS